MIKRINNEGGTILLITLAFVFVFTALGIAAIYHANRQNEFTETLRASTEAFWVADAAVERALSQLPTLYDPPLQDVNFPSLPSYNRGAYDMGSEEASCGSSGGTPIACADRYKITALGKVLNPPHQQIREIIAEAGRFDVGKAIESRGTINTDCQPQAPSVIDGLCEENKNFTFQSTFGGASYAAVVSDAAQSYINPCNGCIPANGITDVTVITLTGANDTLVFDSAAAPNPAFLIIDTTGVNAGLTPTISITGVSGFHGVIWVRGELSIEGNTNIHGSILINGSSGENTSIASTSNIFYDAQDILDAVDELDSHEPVSYKIVSWREI